MRSAVFAAAFAAGAIAVPHQKRAVVTDVDTDVVYVTDVTTVTGAGAAPTTTQVTTTEATQKHWGGHGHSWHWGWSSQQTSEAETTEAPAPTSTEQAPPPAPTTTTTEEAPAPTSTEQPTTWASPSPSTQESSEAQPAATSADSGSTPVPTTYSEITVYHHNIHRSNHSAANVQWSQSLADTAQKIAASCNYAHDTTMDGGGYGQNIAAGVEGNNVSAVITDLFYNGEVNNYIGLYKEAQPSMANFENWGHFSQIVWVDTNEVGCYTQDCTSGGLSGVASDVSPYFTVCNYSPPGNYANEYGKNVLKPKGDPTAQWNTGL